MNSDWRKDYIRYKSLFVGLVSHYKQRADLKAYLEMMLSLVTISVFTIFALRPTIITIAQLLKDIDAKKAVLAQIDTKIENLARAQSVYESERSKIAVLETSIPKIAQPDVFARQIEGLIGTHQVEVVSFNQTRSVLLGNTPLPATTKEVPLPPETSSTSFTLSVSADVDNYQLVTGLLSDFEKLRIPSVLQEVRISKGKDKDEQKMILFMQGEIPYLLFNIKQ